MITFTIPTVILFAVIAFILGAIIGGTVIYNKAMGK